MSIKFTIKAALVSTVLAVSANAAGHTPVDQRIAAMKAIGGEFRTLGGMAQGKIAYDDFAVISSLEIMLAAANTAQPLFAEPTPEGQKTRAEAAIWADGSDFNLRLDRLIESIDTALTAEPADLESYIPLFIDMANGCKGCHEKYRAPEE